MPRSNGPNRRPDADTPQTPQAVASQNSRPSLDPGSPRTPSTMSNAAVNSVKLVADDSENDNDHKLPMPKSVSRFTLSDKLSNGHSANNNTTNSPDNANNNREAMSQAQSHNNNPPPLNASNGTTTSYKMSPMGGGHEYQSNDRLALPRANTNSTLSSVRMISAEFGGSRVRSKSPIPEADTSSHGGPASPAPSDWSAAVGGAAMGKTSKVIEKLMGERDALKRNLQVEKLNAEEARTALKMTEERLDSINEEHATELHEAGINKTLLKKRDRQLADLKDRVDIERGRAEAALERERVWKDTLEKTEAECKRNVDEATNRAVLAEGRHNAISSHWGDQGATVSQAVTKHKKDIKEILRLRIKDAERMDELQQLCDQQEKALASLQQEKEKIAIAAKTYQEAQEKSLAGIKNDAKEREEAQQKTIEEATEVLHKLKWALNVKENVKGAK